MLLKMVHMILRLQVLFQNDSPATLLARVIGIISPIDQSMLAKGRDTYKYFTKNHMLYERNQVNLCCVVKYFLTCECDMKPPYSSKPFFILKYAIICIVVCDVCCSFLLCTCNFMFSINVIVNFSHTIYSMSSYGEVRSM